MLYKKVFVVCPGNVVTGGPELLHQLVHELREIGVNAFISYYPFTSSFEVPKQYLKYNISIRNPEKFDENALIIPESATRLAKKYKPMHVIVWWQSVDNYYRIPRQNGWRAFIPLILASRLARSSLRALKKYTHVTQSEYARRHLEINNIQAHMLGDYLSENHITKKTQNNRSNTIAYNPKKGTKISNQLISNFPNVKFQAIENMTTEEVNLLLSSVKIYMDFGNHPGKDRLPREAAMAGACVITGKRGAAANPLDIPIPEIYKLNDSSEKFLDEFESIVTSIFEDFEENSFKFSSYRQKIINEHENFKKQCHDLFLI